jgi:hypothetical protein
MAPASSSLLGVLRKGVVRRGKPRVQPSRDDTANNERPKLLSAAVDVEIARAYPTSMSKSSLRILVPILVAFTLACDSSPEKPAAPAADKPAAPAADKPAAPAAEQPAAPAVEQPAAAGEPAAAPTDYSGTYKNSGGATLTIQNFAADKGFDFHLVIKSEDDCNGVDYSGTVKLTEPNKATNDQADLFKLDAGRVNFEPGTEMIGMDCARVLDVEFSKQP